MAMIFENVRIASFTENNELQQNFNTPVRLEVSSEQKKISIKIINDSTIVQRIEIGDDLETAKVGACSAVVTSGAISIMVVMASAEDIQDLLCKIRGQTSGKKKKAQSTFEERTDAASAEQYFQFYGYLSQQQNMMQDYVRTATYQRAMLDNTLDFQDKVVLDVGAGSGILSFFAVQAGARKVYAIEASSIAKHCQMLVHNNKLSHKIEVIAAKIEEVDLPEMVDVIVSEPMGYMLFNERMLETFLHAKKWLKPGGLMFPTEGHLHITPFMDDALFMEQYSKANFWYQPSFHGVDLCSLREEAVSEYFKQPIVDTFDVRICLAKTEKYVVDFQTAQENELHRIEIPLTFHITQTGTIHGLAFWFDVSFNGSQNTVWLSTCPTQQLTHWYQVRCLLQNPVLVKQGQKVSAKVILRCNVRQSYDVDMEVTIPGTATKSCNTLDLKNPFFRYTGQQPQPPPGCTTSTDAYWDQQEVPMDKPVAYLTDAYWDESNATEYNLQGANYMITVLNNNGTADLVPTAHSIAQPQQLGVVPNNLVPLVNVASVNPGSIPAATVVNSSNVLHGGTGSRTSIGGGISPALFAQPATSPSSSHLYPVSNQFMIGDYVVPGSVILPTQGLTASAISNYNAV